MYQLTHWAVAVSRSSRSFQGPSRQTSSRLQGLAQGLGGGACVGGAHGSGRCDRCPRRRVVRCRRWTGTEIRGRCGGPGRSGIGLRGACASRSPAPGRRPRCRCPVRLLVAQPTMRRAYRSRDEGGAAEPRPGRHVGVGSAGGALPAFSRVGFRRPPSEPDVRIPAHPALHPCYAVAFAVQGLGMRVPR